MKTVAEEYDYRISIKYENSNQWRDGGTYESIEEVIEALPNIMKSFNYGFGDIHVSQLRPDPTWGHRWVNVMTIPR